MISFIKHVNERKANMFRMAIYHFFCVVYVCAKNLHNGNAHVAKLGDYSGTYFGLQPPKHLDGMMRGNDFCFAR